MNTFDHEVCGLSWANHQVLGGTQSTFYPVLVSGNNQNQAKPRSDLIFLKKTAARKTVVINTTIEILIQRTSGFATVVLLSFNSFSDASLCRFSFHSLVSLILQVEIFFPLIRTIRWSAVGGRDLETGLRTLWSRTAPRIYTRVPVAMSPCLARTSSMLACVNTCLQKYLSMKRYVTLKSALTLKLNLKLIFQILWISFCVSLCDHRSSRYLLLDTIAAKYS